MTNGERDSEGRRRRERGGERRIKTREREEMTDCFRK